MIKAIPHIFTRDFPFMEKIEFFRKVLYVVLLFNAITLLPIAYEVYGYYGMVGTLGWNTNISFFDHGSSGLVQLLSHPANGSRPWIMWVFVIGQMLFLFTGILKILPRISSVMVFFFTVNLFIKGYIAFTGGEALVNVMLFYMMFIHPKREDNWIGDLQNILNNTFYWMLLIQVCVLYIFSAWYKILDPEWASGKALMYVSRIDAYGSWMTQSFANVEILAVIGTYASLFYQASFAVLVWIKKIKIPFLIFGVIFHLIIAIGMGIFNFGIVMIVMYILFLDDKQVNWLKSKLRLRKRAIAEKA
ncbi:hypothetical protein K6119_05675 [Paracrocinitomix mangrovi]|uniref:hypothetical protein n=1 Tax=Paracrocinitomix mangrovi TaxID=2862509 RepID=UPI001C8DA21D|nr:hypothetical protein [Paracrocinitomix mangrovi]UKN03003.1 hypothetical protein K6119_05675 [Paracrocinitomix mangrovi]